MLYGKFCCGGNCCLIIVTSWSSLSNATLLGVILCFNCGMPILLSDCHFWTADEKIDEKHTVSDAFRIVDIHDIIPIKIKSQGRRGHIECRSGNTVSRNNKLTDCSKTKIRKLEYLLSTQRVVCLRWQNPAVILALFSNGLIAYICIDIYTGGILRILFEKYFVGKLAAECINDAFFTRSHIVLSYNTNQLTVVYLQKANGSQKGPEKINRMDPRIFHFLVPGPEERKLSRQLVVNSSYDLFVVWTKSSQNEVYPWRPTVRDQDRANIHIFKLKGLKMELLAYCWTENDPLCVDFLRSAESQVLTVEQKMSLTGEILIEICSYEINTGKMQKVILTTITMGYQICSCGFSPDQEKLFLGTIERSVCSYDLLKNQKFVSKIDIVPVHCSWHPDSSVIVVANNQSQFQCFDLALSPITNQLQSENGTSSVLIDISHYFRIQPTLLRMSFSPKPDLANFRHVYAQTDSFLFVLFENGPLGCLRFFAGSGMKSDIHNSGLTTDVFIDKYLSLHQLNNAVSLLTALNWETYGAMCLISLHKIANYVFFRSKGECTDIELMIKSFETFKTSLSEDTKDEFSDQVYDLKRRFFFFLIRNQNYTDSYIVARDIGDYDLFMDLYNNTKIRKDLTKLSRTYFNNALAIIQKENGDGNICNTENYHTDSTGSQSSGSEAIAKNSEEICLIAGKEQLKYKSAHHSFLKEYVPPLPLLKSNAFNSEMVRISIPKPELRYKFEEINSAGEPFQRNNRRLSGNSKRIATRNNLMEAGPESFADSGIVDHSRVMPINVHQIVGRTNYSQVPQKTSQPRLYQYPLISGTIPPTSKPILQTRGDHFRKRAQKKPFSSILSNGNSSLKSCMETAAFSDVNREAASTKAVGEKNKVKFSDTVEVAMVHEIPRREKLIPQKKVGFLRPGSGNITNPRKELADSLPLCHPNDDYLKDFNPISAGKVP